MNKKEKEVLKIAIERKRGLYSPAEMINVIANYNRSLIEDLVVKGYLEEVQQEVPGGPNHGSMTINFYRVSHKSLVYFEPWYKRLWFYFNGDLRIIIVSIITSAVVTILTILIEKSLK